MINRLERDLYKLQKEIDLIKQKLKKNQKEKKKCPNCKKKQLIAGEYWMSHRPYGYTTGYECKSCKHLFEDYEIRDK